MKAVTMFFFLLVFCASEVLAQEAFNEGDTLRFIAIDVGIGDHSAIATGALFNVGLAYESKYWRIPLTVAVAGELLPLGPGRQVDRYTEVALGVFGKIFSKSILLDLGVNVGRLSHGYNNGYKFRSMSAMFFSLQGELGMSGRSMAGGLSYKRRISEYSGGDIIGAWLRYRFRL
jgi:hypothetical protein